MREEPVSSAELAARSEQIRRQVQIALAVIGDEFRASGMGPVAFGSGMLVSLMFEAARLARVMEVPREDFFDLVRRAWRCGSV
jgi:hypothetical protein